MKQPAIRMEGSIQQPKAAIKIKNRRASFLFLAIRVRLTVRFCFLVTALSTVELLCTAGLCRGPFVTWNEFKLELLFNRLSATSTVGWLSLDGLLYESIPLAG